VIEGNPERKTDGDLEGAAIPILDRLYSSELAAAIALYHELKPRRATTDVSYACGNGRRDRATPGRPRCGCSGLVSDLDGSVTYSAADDAETYSAVEEVARRALSTGAMVMGAKQHELPDRAPLTAIPRDEFH
jgi:hypothetical protein